MSRRLVIVGAGGFGKAVYEWVRLSPNHRKANSISDVVFVDDSLDSLPETIPVISTLASYVPEKNDIVLIAIGSPQKRSQIVERLRDRDVNYHTFVSDHAILARNSFIGAGTVICPGAIIDPGVFVGRHSHLNKNCTIGHDSELGHFTTLSPLVNIMGGVQVEKQVFLGGSAAVLPGLRVGEGATVGAGAIVTRDVKSRTTVVGSPAKTLNR